MTHRHPVAEAVPSHVRARERDRAPARVRGEHVRVRSGVGYRHRDRAGTGADVDDSRRIRADPVESSPTSCSVVRRGVITRPARDARDRPLKRTCPHPVRVAYAHGLTRRHRSERAVVLTERRLAALSLMMATLETTARAPADRERLLALGAALITVTLWASAFVGIRDAAQHFSPGALALGRLSIASLALGLIVLSAPRAAAVSTRPGVIAFVGVFWFGLYNIALIEAERRVDAGTAAMLVNVGPILIAVLAGLILREGFPPRLIAGMAIAFAGVIVIGSATSDGGLTPSWGAVLCLAAAVGYAVGVVAQKPLLTRVSTLQVTWLACTFGAVVCLPFAGTLGSELPDVSPSAIGWMVYLAIAPMALGFLTWGYALARTTAGRMGSMTYLVPPIAILLGWALLGETPPVLAVAGGALCLVGVIVAQRR